MPRNLGGPSEGRTRDLSRARGTLSQLSYRPKTWSGRPGSNRRLSGWEPDVLPLNYARWWTTPRTLRPGLGRCPQQKPAQTWWT